MGAHLGSMENQLDDLANRLDRYPNVAVDTAARMRRLTMQPRDNVRAFILKYQDRILYGTDLPDSGSTDQTASQTWRTNTPSIGITLLLITPSNIREKSRRTQSTALVLKKLCHDKPVDWISGINASPR